MTEVEKILAKAFQQEQCGEFFAAHYSYKSALEIARKTNDSQNIKLCKRKLIETGKKSRSEFKEISTKITIPTAEINKVIGTIIVASDLKTTLGNIGRSRDLFPGSRRIREDSKKNIPITYIFASLSTISEDGHVIRDGDNGERSWYFNSYERAQGLILGLWVAPIFKKLMDEHDLDTMKMISYFKESGIFPPKYIFFLEKGLERYFANDYVSAIHILIPHFESFFIFASNKLGLDTISLNRSQSISTDNRTLSSNLLQSKEFKNVWGEDICDQIDFILFEPLGYKLRHKVAHGEITEEECSFELTTLIIQLFLAMSARVGIKK